METVAKETVERMKRYRLIEGRRETRLLEERNTHEAAKRSTSLTAMAIRSPWEPEPGGKITQLK